MDGKRKKAPGTSVVPVMICALALPVSMFLWIGNIAISFFMSSAESNPYSDDGPVIPPTRWFASVVIPLIVAAWGLRRKSLDRSGAILGVIVGFVLTLTSYCFLACLFTFFVTSSKATKFRSERKRKLQDDFKEGGQRNWIQVLCNGGMATQLALLYLLDSGCGERPVDFLRDYRSSWLSLGVLGAFACCNGDTWASELGSVIGTAEPFLITSRSKVPRGTNGGITVAGLVCSLLGGTVIGIAYYFTVLYTVDPSILEKSPSQLPLIVAGAFAGLAGSIFDSFLGAVFQFSGLDERTGIVVEHPGPGVKHISGYQVLDNHSVNLISSIVMGLVTPPVANCLWP